MSFLILSSTNIDFLDWELLWRTYITQNVLSTTKHIKLIEKKKFSATVIDQEHETFVIYVA